MISKLNCVFFHWLDQQRIKIKIFNSEIESKQTMNVLGVTFNSKLQWSTQVSNIILKANGALHTIRMKKNFFTKNELHTLLTSNYYSIPYYNSEILHNNSLNPNSKQAPASTLRLCDVLNTPTLSYIDLHRSNK